MILTATTKNSVFYNWSSLFTWGASSLFKINVSEVQNPCHHPEQVELLRVIQSDLLHGHTHSVKVGMIVQQRVFQRTCLQMLRSNSQVRLRAETWVNQGTWLLIKLSTATGVNLFQGFVTQCYITILWVQQNTETICSWIFNFKITGIKQELLLIFTVMTTYNKF